MAGCAVQLQAGRRASPDPGREERVACTRVAYRSDDLGPLRRSGVCVREPRRRLGAGHRVTRATGGTADRTAQRTSDKLGHRAARTGS